MEAQLAMILLWILLFVCSVVIYMGYKQHTGVRVRKTVEPFAIAGMDLQQMSMQALDSAPSTSEVKTHYKNLLLFADADIRGQGTKALRILADLRDRLFGTRDFRSDLMVEDILADWPDWLPPLDPTMQEPAPDVTTTVNSEVRILAYLQRYYPEEPNVDEQTGAVIRNLIEDFGYRFVFQKGKETVSLRTDFLREPLLHNWVNPTTVALPPA